jgi:hypothetical protein
MVAQGTMNINIVLTLPLPLTLNCRVILIFCQITRHHDDPFHSPIPPSSGPGPLFQPRATHCYLIHRARRGLERPTWLNCPGQRQLNWRPANQSCQLPRAATALQPTPRSDPISAAQKFRNSKLSAPISVDPRRNEAPRKAHHSSTDRRIPGRTARWLSNSSSRAPWRAT